jgi:hypothetical protein
MWDRHDPRWREDRGRGEPCDRRRGAHHGTGDRDREDARDVFTRELDLPRGGHRELVRERERVYEVNGAESRMLATVGAFRVVPESDLLTLREGGGNVRRSLQHLEDVGLVRRSRLSPDDRVVTLTDRSQDLLEANGRERPDGAREPRQTFYAGLRRPRELTHDAKIYSAYERTEARLRGEGGRVRRVILDYELKRDYQRFLHERNRGRKDCDGRPDRDLEEIARWAREHELPYDDRHVRFPDARIEYEDRDGLSRHQDIEVVTAHYRGAHAGAAAKSGFSCYRAVRGAVGGRGGCGMRGGGGRRTSHPRLAEELLR